jgi:hypothetical protein
MADRLRYSRSVWRLLGRLAAGLADRLADLLAHGLNGVFASLRSES